MESENLTLSEGVTIRREHFGGIGFNRKTSTTVEFDDEGYLLLKNLSHPADMNSIRKLVSGLFHRSFSPRDLSFVRSMLFYGFLDVARRGNGTRARVREGPVNNGYLSAPETVHLSVTSRCNLKSELRQPKIGI